MKYLCLVYGEPGFLTALNAEERAQLDRDSIDYDDQLMRGGHFIAASALQPVQTASTIRVRGGQVLATDGPFAETKEVLCGFIFIEAADMAEAKRLAEKIPMARHGSIEVRPELDIRAH
jgi:hypothetical protein